MQCILHYVVMLQHSSWSKSLICDWAVWNTKLSSRDLIYCNTTVWYMLVLLVSNFQLCLGSLVHGIIVLVKNKGNVGFCRFSYLIGFMLLHLSVGNFVQNLARNINKWVNHLRLMITCNLQKLQQMELEASSSFSHHWNIDFLPVKVF